MRLASGAKLRHCKTSGRCCRSLHYGPEPVAVWCRSRAGKPEGIRSTGANAFQRARLGVIPQITPVLLSQVLYYLESNTRSATVIGAIVGGGIGLLLTQAIITQKDGEEVSYYIVLIVLMVMAMDTFSGWLRKRLIKG